MNKPISTWTQTFYKLGYTLRRVWRDEPDYTDNYTPLAIEVLEDRQMLSGFGGDDDMGGGGTGGGGSSEFGSGGGGDSNAGFVGGAVGGNNTLSGLSGQSPTTLFSYDVSPDRINLPDYWSNLPGGYSYQGVNPWDFRPTHSTPPTLSNYRLTEQTELEGFPGTFIVTLSHFEIESFQVTSTGSQSLGNYEYTEHVRAKLTQTIIETTSPSTVRDAFESDTHATFTSYIRFTATIEYQFNLRLLNGQTTSFDQNVVKEDTTTEFHWTTNNIKSPFSAGVYLEPQYTKTSSGSATIEGKVSGNASIRVQAERSGTSIAYTVSGNGRNWTPDEQPMKTSIDYKATATAGLVLSTSDLVPSLEPESDSAIDERFGDRFVPKGEVGEYQEFSIVGNSTTKFDRRFTVHSVDLRKSNNTTATLTGAFTRSFLDDTEVGNDLTTIWISHEGQVNVIRIGEDANEESFDATDGEHLAAEANSVMDYRPARTGELSDGESTWLYDRAFSKSIDQDVFRINKNNQLRTEYISDGTKREQLAHGSSSTEDVASAQPVLTIQITKNFKSDGVSNEYFWAKERVQGNSNLGFVSNNLFTIETFEADRSDTQHVTGQASTVVRARVLKQDNQPGFNVIPAAGFSGEVLVTGTDRTESQIHVGEDTRNEKAGILVRSSTSTDIASDAVNANDALVVVDSLAHVERTSDLRWTERRDDQQSLEYRFVDANTVTIHDNSKYQTTTHNYSGTVTTDDKIEQEPLHGSSFTYRYHNRTEEEIAGQELKDGTNGEQAVLEIKNNTTVTMQRAARSENADDLEIVTPAPVTDVSSDSPLSIDLSEFSFKQKSGIEKIKYAGSTEITYKPEVNYGESLLIKTDYSQDLTVHTHDHQSWHRQGTMSNSVNFTKTTTFQYTPEGPPSMDAPERFKIVYAGRATEIGDITETTDRTFREVSSSEGLSHGLTAQEFRETWHSGRKDALDQNGTAPHDQVFSDFIDNRNETAVLTSNDEDIVNLTYVVAELPVATTSSNATNGSSQNANNGTSQYSGTGSTLPPTLSGSEPVIDANRYRSVVTGTKTETVKNDVKTTTNSAFRQNLHGVQRVSIAESSAWWGETPMEIRTHLERTATTDQKTFVRRDGPTAPKNEVKIRKATEIRFEPTQITVTVNAVGDAENTENRAIMSKELFEEFTGYLYETNDVFDGDFTFVISKQDDGSEVTSEGTGTHGLQSRSFAEWKDSDHTGVFLSLKSTELTRVGATPVMYVRQIGAQEDQDAVARSLSGQQSGLPKFDNTWSQTGTLVVESQERVSQANLGVTQSQVRWKIPDEWSASNKIIRYDDRAVERYRSVMTTLVGNTDGSSTTQTVINNRDEQRWDKKGLGSFIYVNNLLFSSQSSSSYSFENQGLYRETLDRSATSTFSGDVETHRIDTRTDSISTNGSGNSKTESNDSEVDITETWSGSNNVRRTSTLTSPEMSVLGAEEVTVVYREKGRGFGGQQVYDTGDTPRPSRHFVLERDLETIDHKWTPDENYINYTNYSNNQTTGWFDAFQGGVGVIVGIVGVSTGVFTVPSALTVVASADRFVSGIRAIATGRQTESLLTMAAANGFEWALQANYQLPDFDLTHEERRAVGEIAEFGLIFGAGTVAKVTKVSQKFVVAAKIFQQTAAACDDIAQIGRALKSFREAGQVLAGKTDIQTSIRNILDNYCFVGTVDVMTYDTGNKLMGIAVTPTVPLIETSFGVPRDVAAGWIIIGAGAMALLPVFSGRRANRHAEEHAQADSDWVWA